MATASWYECTSCGTSYWPGGLFEVFSRWVREGGASPCPKCGQQYDYRLTFPFAFGADGRIRVLDIFAAEPRKWIDPDTGHWIGFHPFLVIGETLAATPEQTAWLPYWHTDESEGRMRRKFGQWAPHMDLELFAQLVDQARARGYLG